MTDEPDFDAADLLVRDFLRTATPRQRHAYVCGTNLDDGDDWTEDYLDEPVARAIPPTMLVAAPGEAVEDETEDGLPLEVYERYAALVG